jgi:hypothetical protein
VEDVKLTYNRATGFVKLGGAIIGEIEFGLTPGFRPFRFNAEVIERNSLNDLLPAIREYLEGAPFALPIPSRTGGGRRRKKSA